ncbi:MULTISPECIES: YflJ family protein [unclassified Bacillus (in: firmicutes)]|uniref:YflJ family protein n=1 Tax=unclassified Bacillus (in: firmicutes) TaxID=185979 RepID=UPI0008F2BAED|nr:MULTISPECIES: YflJ family protein [unclassified Bacillus (in: firmicutes)]SFA91877.1 Protein of unknown function [Bacillus sp. UNCCL13]SFQ85703.1 Protein of unknown function [Bacillus sp. cl95]
MAYQYSKGWFIQQLKQKGLSKHPIERKKLELYKTSIIRNLYVEYCDSNTKE